MSCDIYSAEFKQTPEEKLDWQIDWADRGLGDDTIATSVWEGSSDDFTMSDKTNTDTTTKMYLTGGVAGNVYAITNTITTAGGLTMQETIPYVCMPVRLIAQEFSLP